MNYFSTFFFSKGRRNGRSYGRITVRHRGGGYFKKFIQTIQQPFSHSYGILTFLCRINFSGFKFPLFIFINSYNKYTLFTHKFFPIFSDRELELKNFFLLKVFNYFNPSTFVLDDEHKPFNTAFYLTNFLNVSNSTFIRFLTFFPNSKFQYARANDTYARFVKTRGAFSIVRLPSGSLIRFSKLSSFICFGYRNPFSDKKVLGTKNLSQLAGKIRNLGIRPHVRGVAMNPVDHPHGGRTGESRPSVSPWAKLTKGYPTVRRRKL